MGSRRDTIYADLAVLELLLLILKLLEESLLLIKFYWQSDNLFHGC